MEAKSKELDVWRKASKGEERVKIIPKQWMTR